jgi:hypothetical protein
MLAFLAWLTGELHRHPGLVRPGILLLDSPSAGVRMNYTTLATEQLHHGLQARMSYRSTWNQGAPVDVLCWDWSSWGCKRKTSVSAMIDSLSRPLSSAC